MKIEKINPKAWVEIEPTRSVSEIESYNPMLIDDWLLMIQEILINNKETIATAESCTGGGVSALLISKSGSSEFFNGGIVAYSNDVKINVLGVDRDIIDTFGVVSEQVVEAMACSVCKMFNSDYGVATSGFAGPTGGTLEKPNGTVCVCVVKRDGYSHSVTIDCGQPREVCLENAINRVIYLIKQELIRK